MIRRKIYWIKLFLKFIFFKKRFLSFSSIFTKKFTVYERVSKSSVPLQVRSEVDIGTNYQVFADEQFSLDFLDSGYVQHPRNLELFHLYENLLINNKKPLIIDCGSNNGSSALYFSLVYPGSKVLGYEISKNNFDFSNKNFKNTEFDIEFFNLGIASERGKAKIINPNADENSFELLRSTDGDIDLISINEILAEYSDDTGYAPFILKIDIEGGEADLFEKNIEWIDKFPIIIIELHDWCLPGQNTSQNFLKAISHKDRDFVFKGENIFSLSNRTN